MERGIVEEKIKNAKKTVQVIRYPRTATLLLNLTVKEIILREDCAPAVKKIFFESKYLRKITYKYKKCNNYDRRASDAFDVWPKLNGRLYRYTDCRFQLPRSPVSTNSGTFEIVRNVSRYISESAKRFSITFIIETDKTTRGKSE